MQDVNLDLYVEDTKLSFSTDINTIDRVQVTLNYALKDVEDWANSNKLPLNKAKSKTLLVTSKRLKKISSNDWVSLITSKGERLEQVESAWLLGLEIDSELSFNNHVDRLCLKLFQRIGVLNNIKSCLPHKQRILYYNAMIKPNFRYVSEVWQMLCSNDSLKRTLCLQKRAARIILDADSRASSVCLFNRLHWEYDGMMDMCLCAQNFLKSPFE